MTAATEASRTRSQTVTQVVSLLWIIGLCAIDLAFFYHQRTIYLNGDQLHYDGMARLLLTRHVYNYWLTPTPSAMSMPGYPIFLAIIYHFTGLGPRRLEVLWLVQFCLYLLSVYLIYRLGRRLHGRTLGAVMAAVLATMPFIFTEPFRALTENLAIPAFLFYLNLLYEVYVRPVKTLWWCTLGLSLGLMAVIRPSLAELGLVPLILLIRRISRDRRWLVLLLFLICCALPLVPWWVRNFLDFHQFILFDRGEAGNTILAGTYPGYPSGPPNFVPHNMSQAALAKQRIIEGFRHNPLKYFLWFTVWRFNDNFDNIYLPLGGSLMLHLKPLFVLLQRAVVWLSIIFSIALIVRNRVFRHSFLMLLVYSNIILLVMLIPFHPEPRFALYCVILFGIVLMAAPVMLKQARRQKLD